MGRADAPDGFSRSDGGRSARGEVDDLTDEVRDPTGRAGVPVRAPSDHPPLEMTALMSEALARPLAHEQVDLESYREQLVSRGASAEVAASTVEMSLALLDGVDPPATDGAGTTFATWCRTVLAAAVASAPAS